MESIARDKQEDHIIVALIHLAVKSKSGNYLTASQVQEIIVETIYGRKLYTSYYSPKSDTFSIRKELNKAERKAVHLYYTNLATRGIIEYTQNPAIVLLKCVVQSKKTNTGTYYKELPRLNMAVVDSKYFAQTNKHLSKQQEKEICTLFAERNELPDWYTSIVK